MMEYMEDCFNILKCFIDPLGKPTNRKEFYLKASLDIKSCTQAIKMYYDHISKIVNHSKHSQGRIRFCVIFGITLIIPGYFVESPEEFLNPTTHQITDWEVIGPSSDIHGKNRDTAFSFARDLRFHFFQIYFVSAELVKAVKNLSASHFRTRNSLSPAESKILTIAKRLEKLPMALFRDELRQDIPSVKIILDEMQETHLILSYPDNKEILVSPSNDVTFTAWINFIGDDTSNKVIRPYFYPQ